MDLMYGTLAALKRTIENQSISFQLIVQPTQRPEVFLLLRSRVHPLADSHHWLCLPLRRGSHLGGLDTATRGGSWTSC